LAAAAAAGEEEADNQRKKADSDKEKADDDKRRVARDNKKAADDEKKLADDSVSKSCSNEGADATLKPERCCTGLSECREQRPTSDAHYCAKDDPNHGVSCFSTAQICRASCAADAKASYAPTELVSRDEGKAVEQDAQPAAESESTTCPDGYEKAPYKYKGVLAFGEAWIRDGAKGMAECAEKCNQRSDAFVFETSGHACRCYSQAAQDGAQASDSTTCVKLKATGVPVGYPAKSA